MVTAGRYIESRRHLPLRQMTACDDFMRHWRIRAMARRYRMRLVSQYRLT